MHGVRRRETERERAIEEKGTWEKEGNERGQAQWGEGSGQGSDWSERAGVGTQSRRALLTGDKSGSHVGE